MQLKLMMRLALSSRRSLRWLLLAALPFLQAACGSPSGPASNAGSPAMPSRGSAGNGANAATTPGGSSASGATSSPEAQLPTQLAVSPAPEGAAGAADRPVSTDTSTASACEGLDDDACGACVCDKCAAELAACLNVEGCVEIIACVRESGCSGRDCYCGSASLADCLAGDASGPCKDVMLRAPGASTPTLQSPSGGPASDASLQIADCAQARSTCRDVCEASD